MVESKGITENTFRIVWIDIAKFIGITAIVLGHTSTGTLNVITFSFNSIIFFVLSGMTFSRIRGTYDGIFCFNNKSYRDFFKSIFVRIGIPYLVWGSISIVIYSILGKLTTSTLELKQSHFSILPNIVGMLYGNSESGYFEWNRPLWFLPALVLVEIMWFIALKVIYQIKDSLKIRVIYCVTMLLSLLWLVIIPVLNFNLVLPFELETSVGMFFFFGIGILIRSIEWKETKIFGLINKKIRWYIVIFGGGILTVILALINGGTDTRSDNFSNVFIYIFNAIIACATVLLLARSIGNNRVMEYVGKRTLAILVMHKFPIMFIKIVFPKVNGLILEGNVVVSIICTIIVIGLCLVVERIANWIVPWIFGNVRKQCLY